MNAFTEEVRMQQNAIIDSITQVIDLEKTIDSSAIVQGAYIASLRDCDAHIQYGQTWKQFCIDHLNVDYRTAHRRVRAYQWHSVLCIDQERLGDIPYTILDELYDIPDDVDEAEEIIQGLLGGNTVSDIYEIYAPEMAVHQRKPSPVRYRIFRI
jgi:hypothetical protein